MKIEAVEFKYLCKSMLHQPDVWANEIIELVETYGPTDYYHAELNIGDEYFRSLQYVRKFKRNRRGEVVLAIRNRQGRVLLHTKPFYPPEIYRLPTGGIQEGEAVIACVQREIKEETSFSPRFMHLAAIILYTIKNKRTRLPLNSYLFEIEPDGEHPVVQDDAESISGFEWAPFGYLPRIIAQLEALSPERWHDWGSFRSIAHRVLSRNFNIRKPNR